MQHFSHKKLTLKCILLKKIKNLNFYLFKKRKKINKKPSSKFGSREPNSDWDSKEKLFVG